jgi:hypothetical protein
MELKTADAFTWVIANITYAVEIQNDPFLINKLVSRSVGLDSDCYFIFGSNIQRNVIFGRIEDATGCNGGYVI